MRRLFSIIIALAVVFGAGTAMSAPAQASNDDLIYKVQYNPPGSDNGSNSHLNTEYVIIKNTSSKTRYISGWTLSDRTGYRYTFPYTKINPGKFVYVRTGSGTNNWYTRHWNYSWYIWNNTGDKAYLRSPSGTLMDSCSWGSVGSSTSC